jgi:hypothetical protein
MTTETTDTRPTPTPLFQALVRAFPRYGWGGVPLPADPSYPTDVLEAIHQTQPPDHEDLRRAVAELTCQPMSEVSDEQVEQALASCRQGAEGRAVLLVHVLDEYIPQLERLGVDPEGVVDYLRYETRTLASLYYAAAAPTPSPTELRRLAFRLALDPRREVEGGPHEYRCRRTETGWEIGQVGPLGVREATGWPRAIPVSNWATRVILDLAWESPPDYPRLIEFLEGLFEGQPDRHGTLDAAPRLEYLISSGGLVKLWVDGKEVPGITGKNDQLLVNYFCRHPTAKIRGRELERQLTGLKNAAQAAAGVRAAMARVDPAAGGWLQIGPLGWAPGVVPTERLNPGQ